MAVFPKPLQQLERSDVQQLLDEGEAEPLLWEAKGTDLEKNSVRKNVCAFANGLQTGYLILGAERRGELWELPGWRFPDEPPTWVASVIADGVQPLPLIDIRTLPGTTDGSRVAVVEVAPITTPPCFSRGTIYERLPGRSVHLRDPPRLADLYRRGEAAHEGAHQSAISAANAVLAEMKARHGENGLRMALAVNATAHPPDISSRLFSEAYERSLTTAVRDYLVPALGNLPPGFHPVISHGFSQSSRYLLAVDEHQYTHHRFWDARVLWDGTAAIGYSTDSERVSPEEIADGAVTQAWRAAARLLRQLGGSGPSYMELRVFGGGAMAVSSGAVIATLGRGPMDFPPIDEDLASVKRELKRAAGEPAYESPLQAWTPVDYR